MAFSESAADAAYFPALREAQRNGLRSNERPAKAHAWATAILAGYGYNEPARPDIISGYRSPARQRKLLARWNAGDRAGLVARPAERSWHTVRRAIDVESDVFGFEPYAWLLTSYTGARDGRNFDDRGHFDWPTSSLPPSIFQV